MSPQLDLNTKKYLKIHTTAKMYGDRDSLYVRKAKPIKINGLTILVEVTLLEHNF